MSLARYRRCKLGGMCYILGKCNSLITHGKKERKYTGTNDMPSYKEGRSGLQKSQTQTMETRGSSGNKRKSKQITKEENRKVIGNWSASAHRANERKIRKSTTQSSTAASDEPSSATRHQEVRLCPFFFLCVSLCLFMLKGLPLIHTLHSGHTDPRSPGP